jgi:hypothetical protein
LLVNFGFDRLVDTPSPVSTVRFDVSGGVFCDSRFPSDPGTSKEAEGTSATAWSRGTAELVDGFRIFCNQPGEVFLLLILGGLAVVLLSNESENPKIAIFGLLSKRVFFPLFGRLGATMLLETRGAILSSSSITLPSLIVPLVLVLVPSVSVPFPLFPFRRPTRMLKEGERLRSGDRVELGGEPSLVACTRGDNEAGEFGPVATAEKSLGGVMSRSTDTGIGCAGCKEGSGESLVMVKIASAAGSFGGVFYVL